MVSLMVHPGETVRVDRRGFTLIEMMIVVGVIAILAAVVVPSFFRESGKTKSITEVTPMFAELSTKLEVFKSDNGKYVNTTNLTNAAAVVCPSAPSKAGVNGLATCVTSGSAWTTLRVNPPQALLRCSYELQVGDVGDDYQGTLPAGITFTAPTTTGWFSLLATCDADGQGVSSTNGKFFMSSVDSTIQKVNEAL
jgi:prepilin-type N-terminal cleavage/methylation domain-containing protein